MNIRASRLPLVMACPAAAVSPQINIETADEAATLGTAFHHWMHLHVERTPLEVEVVAKMFAVDAGELGFLVGQGLRAWRQVEGFFPSPQTEVALEADAGGVHLTGHADVLSFLRTGDALVDNEIRLLDYKTGHVDADADEQLRGYAWLAMRSVLPMADVERVWTGLLRVREQTIDGRYYSREELEWWGAELPQRLAKVDTYHPGRHCRYCPRGHECPAKSALMADAAHAVLVNADANDSGLVGISGSGLAELLDQAKLVGQAAETIREMVKVAVAAAGGRVETGDGRELVLLNRDIKSIEFERGWPLLLEADLDTQALFAAVKISKTKVEDAICERAPRGMKGKTIKEFLDRLERAGAITTTSQERLEVRRKIKAIVHNQEVTQ